MAFHVHERGYLDAGGRSRPYFCRNIYVIFDTVADMPTRRRVLGAGLATGTAVLAGCTALRQRSPFRRRIEGRSAMFREGPRRRGVVEGVEGPRENVVRKWTIERGEAVGTSLLVDSTLYVGVERDRSPDRGELAALDPVTGRVKWARKLRRPPAPSVIVDGDVIVEDRDLARYPLDGDGEAVWTAEEGARSSLAMEGDRVSASVEIRDRIITVDAETGEILRTPGVSRPSTAVAVADGTTYVGTYDDVFVAISEGGKRLWEYDLGKDVTVTPTVSDGVVLTGGVDFAFHAVAADDGSRLWRAETGGPVYGTPAVTNGTVIAAGTDGVVRAFALHTGEQYWAQDTGQSLERSFRAGPITDGRTVYCADFGGRVHAFDVATGGKLWTHDIGTAIRAEPTIGEGHLFVTVPDGRVVALTEEGGE